MRTPVLSVITFPIRNSLWQLLLWVLLSHAGAANSAIPDPALTPVNIGSSTLMVRIWQPKSSNSETIIALPGSGGDITRYRLLGPLLADAGYQVIAINQRGIMGSTGNLDDLTLYDFANDVIAVADSLQIDKFHMLGWALGNRIARAAAVKYPERIATVSLIAAGGLAKPLTVPGELNQLLGNPELAKSAKIELAKRTLFSPSSADELVNHYVENLRYWPRARAAQIQANQTTPREEWWAGGTGPMLVIQGLDDKIAPPANGQQLKADFGDRITLENLPDAGHLMGLEKPHKTAQAIVVYLSAHPISD